MTDATRTPLEIQGDYMSRMRVLVGTNPDVYAYAFAWLAGAASANPKLGEHINKAIDFVERTYPR